MLKLIVFMSGLNLFRLVKVATVYARVVASPAYAHRDSASVSRKTIRLVVTTEAIIPNRNM